MMKTLHQERVLSTRELSTIEHIGITALLIVLAVFLRLWWQDIPNFEPLMLITLISASILNRKWAFVVAIVSIAISDMLIGNSAILLFTWSAWAGISVGSFFLRQRSKKVLRYSIELTITGVAGAVFFFLWTNCGVWLQGWYPMTAAGLLQSYINALPFLYKHIQSVLITIPIGSVVWIHVYRYYMKARLDYTASTAHNLEYK